MTQQADEAGQQTGGLTEPIDMGEGAPLKPRDEGLGLRVVPPQDPGASSNEGRQPRSRVPLDTRAVLFQGFEKTAVYLICVAVLALAGYALDRNLTTADQVYSSVLDSVRKASETEGVMDRDQLTTAVAVIAMRDMSLLRSTVLFVGFIVILMGCVFVLKGVEAMYKLRLNTGERQATFSTASPGLVLITAGVVLVIVALRQESAVQLKLDGGAGDPRVKQGDPAMEGESVQHEGKVGSVAQ